MPTVTTRAAFHAITPLVPAGPSLLEALAFYTEKMGFTIVWQSDTMAGIARNNIMLNLVENDNRAWGDNASFSIGVSDLDALYEEYRQIVAQVGPVETKAWGRREFHLITPAGVAFQFYQQQAK